MWLVMQCIEHHLQKKLYYIFRILVRLKPSFGGSKCKRSRNQSLSQSTLKWFNTQDRICENGLPSLVFISCLNIELNMSSMYVTSFLSISYWSNSEYWSQKQAQSRNIHSMILVVHVGWQSAQNFPLFPTLKEDSYFYFKNLPRVSYYTLQILTNIENTTYNKLHGHLLL